MANPHRSPDPQPVHPPFVEKSLRWLLASQHPQGGWGSGSHARQTHRDPHAVQTDPATTAFAAMALLRAGYQPAHDEAVRRATESLVRSVEASAPDSPRVTSLHGTQPQSKLGELIDTSMAAQFLARLLPTLPDHDPLKTSVNHALDACITKLSRSQQSDGSWGRGGWAPVLQSSMSFAALEYAQVSGKSAGREALKRARDYQKKNYDAVTNTATASEAAGVELYSFASTQRAAASETRAAQEAIERAKAKGDLEEDAPVTPETLRKAGLTEASARSYARAYEQNAKQAERLDDDGLLSGFGTNGGEEFLSYMLTSEALVIAGGDAWEAWNDKMHEQLKAVQCPDGSWTGHHCITSPVFCTAAVVQCLTAERDADLLSAVARASTDDEQEVA